MDLKDHIRGIPDFPKPGIFFYDISTLLRDADAWQVAMGRMAKAVRAYQPDLLAGVESRGFLIAAPLALKLGCGFVMLRKRGKLPGETIGLEYALEYGSDRIEVQADAIEAGQRVVVVDDLLATGGTMAAGIALLRKVGAVPVRTVSARRAVRGPGLVRRLDLRQDNGARRRHSGEAADRNAARALRHLELAWVCPQPQRVHDLATLIEREHIVLVAVAVRRDAEAVDRVGRAAGEGDQALE